MDLTTLPFLLMKGDTSYFVIALMIILPHINKILNLLYDKILSFIKNREYKSWNYITFTGHETINNGNNFYDYPKAFIAISYYTYKNNLCNDLKNITVCRNSFDYYSDRSTKQDKTQNYLINKADNILLEDDIYLDIKTNDEILKDNKDDSKVTGSTFKIHLIIKSKTKNLIDLRNFVEKCLKDYDKYSDETNAGKLYHFVYKGKTTVNPRLQFDTNLLSDLNNPSEKNYQTFDHLFHEHKEKLLDDIHKLRDIEYYKKNGLKRKKGYLFYGHPGCGKTSSVIAMALEDDRHIIEIPMSRVKTNGELEEILNLTEINCVKFRKEQIIILFDEIDTGSESTNKRKYEEIIEKPEGPPLDKDKEKEYIKKPLDDELNMGTILSRLDGIGNYNGLIIIATTNCKDSLSPALYRYGRLDPIFFDYAKQKDIINMIESHFKINLELEQKEKIIKESTFSQSYIRSILDNNYDIENILLTFSIK